MKDWSSDCKYGGALWEWGTSASNWCLSQPESTSSSSVFLLFTLLFCCLHHSYYVWPFYKLWMQAESGQHPQEEHSWSSHSCPVCMNDRLWSIKDRQQEVRLQIPSGGEPMTNPGMSEWAEHQRECLLTDGGNGITGSWKYESFNPMCNRMVLISAPQKYINWKLIWKYVLGRY